MEPWNSLKIVSVYLADANEYVRKKHRHHKPVLGAICTVAVADDQGVIHGVAIAGRPLARMLDDKVTAEITRCCTDGTPNACSMLYGTMRKALRALGYTRIITYTLPQEGGASLKAAGFRFDGDAGGGDWFRKNSPRRSNHTPSDLLGGKWRWIA